MSSRLITISTANLNQSALNFENNINNIIDAIKEAKEAGSQILLTSELSIPSYGCEDHFLELDTYDHCWECLAKLLEDPDLTQNIFVVVGMPVIFDNVSYNCAVILFCGRIVGFRPKTALCDDLNYREGRYFTPWNKNVRDLALPRIIFNTNGQMYASIGNVIFSYIDIKIGIEICEELWAIDPIHIEQYKQDVDVILNLSGSHHQLRKLNQRIDLIRSATKHGGCYVYSNQIGCDGGRLYYDGCSCIVQNTNMYAQASQFSVKQVEVVTATLDLNRSTSEQISMKSACYQKSLAPPFETIEFESYLCHNNYNKLSKIIEPKYYDPMEEIALGPAIWLWDYVRKSKLGGFFLPLSGGSDSATTALIVYSMCNVLKAHFFDLQNKDIVHYNLNPTDTPNDICGKIFHTTYMASANSSEETKLFASELAEQIGSNHHELNIDKITSAIMEETAHIFKQPPKFKSNGGTEKENLALQNIQARSRMVLSYYLAQLLSENNLLVLGSGNMDELLRGYMTKYDCSSADINPIGSICKMDIFAFLDWCSEKYSIDIVSKIRSAPPTAELEPITSEYKQNDEEDMGFTYEDLSQMGKLRKIERLGPVSMFRRIYCEGNVNVKCALDKVKRFFKYYAINRHKATIVTPSYHCENYSPDDNRFDLRPFLYDGLFKYQYEKMDEVAEEMSNSCISKCLQICSNCDEKLSKVVESFDEDDNSDTEL